MNAITDYAAPCCPEQSLTKRLIDAASAGGARVMALARAWKDRQAERRMFTQMDDRMLRDIGVSRSEMSTRLNEPFWRSCPPNHSHGDVI